jgi:uncharacterized protein
MTDTEHSDQNFLEYVVKSIVDTPEDVKVDRTIDEMGVLLTLHVNAKDMGQVVGRQGSTAKAIRSLLKIVGVKSNARVNLKIEEPEGGRRQADRPMRPRVEESENKEVSKEASSDGGIDMGGTTVGQVIDDIKKDL